LNRLRFRLGYLQTRESNKGAKSDEHENPADRRHPLRAYKYPEGNLPQRVFFPTFTFLSAVYPVGAAIVLGAGDGVPVNTPKPGATAVTQEMSAPAYDPDFVFENKFEVAPNPDKYTPAISNFPGILLSVKEQASGKAAMMYECESSDDVRV
jgi:hypothetical protein